MTNSILFLILILLPIIVGIVELILKVENKYIFFSTFITGSLIGLIIQSITESHVHVPFSNLIFIVLGIILGIVVGGSIVVVRILVQKMQNTK